MPLMKRISITYTYVQTLWNFIPSQQCSRPPSKLRFKVLGNLPISLPLDKYLISCFLWVWYWWCKKAISKWQTFGMKNVWNDKDYNVKSIFEGNLLTTMKSEILRNSIFDCILKILNL